MEEIKNHLPKLKTVKKATYSGIVNTALLNINPENEPIKNVGGPRSQSFKKIVTFVPNLKPKKSTFIPPALKLNLLNKLSNKEKDDTDIDKQISGDEIEIIDNSSSSSSCSISSSDMENENESNEEFEKKDTEDKNDNNNKFKLKEIKEFLNDDEEENIEINKNMKNLRRKMSQIKARVIIKNKESEGTIHDKFKNKYDIGLKDYEKENDVNTLHGSIIRSEHKKNNKKPKTKSIFEVLSSGKKLNIKEV